MLLSPFTACVLDEGRVTEIHVLMIIVELTLKTLFMLSDTGGMGSAEPNSEPLRGLPTLSNAKHPPQRPAFVHVTTLTP